MRHLLLLSLVFIQVSLASVSNGKHIYKSQCLQCHVKGGYLASQKKAKQWSKVLTTKDKTNPLSALHLNSNKAQDSWIYFKSKTYLQDIKHLKAFLQKYSQDRGKHNSCN